MRYFHNTLASESGYLDSHIHLIQQDTRGNSDTGVSDEEKAVFHFYRKSYFDKYPKAVLTLLVIHSADTCSLFFAILLSILASTSILHLKAWAQL